MERFHDHATEDIYNGRHTPAARRAIPNQLLRIAERKLSYVVTATTLSDLRFPPGNYLEQLSGDRAGQHSIRINDQYRICFKWTDQGATRIEITDYH